MKRIALTIALLLMAPLVARAEFLSSPELIRGFAFILICALLVFVVSVIGGIYLIWTRIMEVQSSSSKNDTKTRILLGIYALPQIITILWLDLSLLKDVSLFILFCATVITSVTSKHQFERILSWLPRIKNKRPPKQ
jgi:hypothetical protein